MRLVFVGGNSSASAFSHPQSHGRATRCLASGSQRGFFARWESITIQCKVFPTVFERALLYRILNKRRREKGEKKTLKTIDFHSTRKFTFDDNFRISYPLRKLKKRSRTFFQRCCKKRLENIIDPRSARVSQLNLRGINCIYNRTEYVRENSRDICLNHRKIKSWRGRSGTSFNREHSKSRKISWISNLSPLRLPEISPLGYFKLEDREESRIPLYITRLVPFVRDL